MITPRSHHHSKMEGEDMAPEVEASIVQQQTWEQLSAAARKFLPTQYALDPGFEHLTHTCRAAWQQTVLRYSIRRQLRWKNSLVRRLVCFPPASARTSSLAQVPDEKAYYSGTFALAPCAFLNHTVELMKQCKSRMMVSCLVVNCK
jgi:hypothetical protein